MIEENTIAFLGSGNMAEALISGLVRSPGIVPADQMVASDVVPQRLQDLQSRYGIQTTSSNIEAVNAADIVILAVKSQIMRTVLQGISDDVDETKLIISLAAGVKIAVIAQYLKPMVRIIRVMPNVAALVHAAVTAISRGMNATDNDVLIAQEIFHAVGDIVVVEEKLMDAVTGLSGSGPGYVFAIINALADGGVKVGLSKVLALKLAAQTVYGAAKMLIETGEHPMKLRDMVTSPGGTTITGLHSLERDGFGATLMNAVEAATQRSKELGTEGNS